jgi:hypothetical protein
MGVAGKIGGVICDGQTKQKAIYTGEDKKEGYVLQRFDNSFTRSFRLYASFCALLFCFGI